MGSSTGTTQRTASTSRGSRTYADLAELVEKSCKGEAEDMALLEEVTGVHSHESEYLTKDTKLAKVVSYL